MQSERECWGELVIHKEIPKPLADRGICYELEAVSHNRYLIRETTNVHAAANVMMGKNQLRFKASPAQNDLSAWPANLSGVFLALKNGKIQIETQDPKFWLENPIELPLAEEFLLLRRPDDSNASLQKEMPQLGDRVDLSVNSKGKVEKILAIFGKDEGSIKTFIPQSKP